MKIGVIMGGVSSEREVSLQSGKGILANLDRSKYEVIPIDITSREELTEKAKGLDLALLALHGSYGEDGTVQGTLETMGIPYTGSGVLSSSICMNKDLSKKLLRVEGISTADWLCWSSISDYSAEAVERLGYPVVVKPNSGGSSIGTHIVRNREALRAAVEDAFRWDTEVMIEQFIQGEEITCAVIDGELLPIIRIQANGSDWFDFSAKYEEGGALEEVVQLPAEVHERVHSAALGSYRALKCSVYARVDMMLRNGIPYVLEVNTLPGMTKTSLLPKSAEAAGMTYSSLLDRIIQLSLDKVQKAADSVEDTNTEKTAGNGKSNENQGVLSHG